MSELTDNLKAAHSVIFEALESAKRLGIHSGEGRSRLGFVKQRLIEHLRAEDAYLYPALRRAAEKDGKLGQTLEYFAGDMDTVSRFAMAFLDKYSGGGTGLEFAREFGKLYATLKMRMDKEENVLYREYDRMSGF